MTAQVDEHQHLSRIFISDVLPDGLAYGEGPCGRRYLSSLLIPCSAVWLVKFAHDFVRKQFLLEF